MLRLPVIAIITGLSILLATVSFSTKNPGLFINLPGLSIIIGGILTALFFSYSKSDILTAFKTVKLLINHQTIDKQQTIKDMTAVAYLWSRKDLKGVERKLATIDNGFLHTGVQHIIDGRSTEEITAVLNWKIRQLHHSEYRSAKLFHSLAVFAPAFGMVGTLLGLVNMMYLISEQPSADVASHLAIALVTTFYGLILANVFFKPIAIKLERRADQLVDWMRIMMMGVMMIEKRKSAAFIELAMETLDPFEHQNLGAELTSRPLEPALNH